MFGLGKSKKSTQSASQTQKIDRKVLFAAVDSALDNWLEASGTDELLQETGKTRQQLLDAVLADDEVESCREDLRTAILAEPWRLFALGAGGEELSEDIINRLYKNIRNHAKTFAELAILAKFNGYAVAEYVYEQEADGFIQLKQVLNKDGELDKYTPKRDGTVTLNHEGDDVTINTKVKYLFVTSKAVPARPAGELMIIRAYPAVAMRKRGWAYAGQFIARYAQPYVVGKQGGYSSTGLNDFVSKVFAFLSGGAIGIGKDDAIDIHQLSGDGEAFEKLERLANRRIQKLLLGRVKNSELNTGSRAAQQTDDEARQDRISGYLDIMTAAIQHAIDALLLVNQHFGMSINAPRGLWFEYQQQFKPDKVRAEVDKIYAETGIVERTKDYFTDMLGWEESHFKMVDKANAAKTDSQQHKPALPLPLALSLSHSLPYSAKYQQVQLSKKKDQDSSELDTQAQADQTQENQANERKLMQPKVDAVLQLLNNSQGYAQFSQQLDALELENDDLIEDLAVQCADSYVQGMRGVQHVHPSTADTDTADIDKGDKHA